jgi:hypothetical protein
LTRMAEVPASGFGGDKKAPREYGSTAGQVLARFGWGASKRALTVTAAAAPRGNPRKLLTRRLRGEPPAALGEPRLVRAVAKKKRWGLVCRRRLVADQFPATGTRPVRFGLTITPRMVHSGRGRAHCRVDLNLLLTAMSAAPTNTKTDRARTISPVTNSSE